MKKTRCTKAIALLAATATAWTAAAAVEGVARVVRVDPPVKVWTNAAGRVVADFGNDMFGSVEVVPGIDGAEVWVGEKLSGDGIDRNPPGSVRAGRLPLVADKRNTGPKAVPIPAEFGVVMPFRYAEFDAAAGLEVRRKTLIVPMDMSASSFECSDEKLNKVWQFCKQTILATSFAGIYVDGDRERIPYEADAYVNMLGEQAVWADGAMARATIAWLAENPTWPTEWAQMFVSFVYGYYLATGDRETFDRYVPLCRERMRVGKVRKDGLVIKRAKNIVDWPVCERDGYDMGVGVNAVVNALYWRNLRELGEENGAARVKAAFASAFVDKKTGLVRDGEGSTHHSLHANALALSLGLVPDAHRARAWEFCKSRKMACSPYFAQFLLEAAFEMDDPDYAIELMTAEDERSWLGMMRDGATMAMEAWNQEVKPNQDWNHAWSTAPLNIAMRKILGVEPIEPGYASVRIRPQLGSLAFANGKMPTVRGAIAVNCSRDALAVVIPRGIRAEVVLPWNGETRNVGEGRHVFRLKIPAIASATSIAAYGVGIGSIADIRTAEALREGFREQPQDVKIGCYYYWVNERVDEEGVKKDLMWMKENGITRAFLATDIRNHDFPGQTYGENKFMGGHWWKCLETALATAGELGIEMGIFNGPGWSQSGGPWIKPEEAMRNWNPTNGWELATLRGEVTKCGPCSPEATGLEVDKLSAKHVRKHFDSFFGDILRRIPAEKRPTLTTVVIDSWEKGRQNYTDDIFERFKARFGYELDYTSDKCKKDLRQLLAELVASEYVGTLTSCAHENGLITWCEPYAHSPTIMDGITYGLASDEVSAEFWASGRDRVQEMRNALGAARRGGKNKVYAESFTSGDLRKWAKDDWSFATLKPVADKFFHQGVNATILHVVISQPGDDTEPPVRPWFGTFFDRRSRNAAEVKTLVEYCRRCNYMLQVGKPFEGRPDERILDDGTRIRFTEQSLFEVVFPDGRTETWNPVSGELGM